MNSKIGLKILFFMGFIIALSEAFPGYIRSSFLEEFVSVQTVGFFFLGAAILTLVVINFFPILIRKFSNFWIFVSVIILNILSTILLITTQSTLLVFTGFIFILATINLMWINMDVFIEKLTENVTTGRTRTMYYTILSAGWLASPLIVGYIVGENNYRLVYVFAIAFLIVVLGILFAKRKYFKKHITFEHHHTWKSLKHIWRNVNLRGVFAISFLLEFFFITTIVYMPIYLHENIGLDWLTIGIIFTVMLVPYIFLEIPAGTIADKYHNEKKIFMFGFMIMAASAGLIFFIDSTNPIIWALILFLTRCGAALIQSMRETYFFKNVNVENIDYINFFRDVKPLAILMGMGISVLVLEFYPLRYLFLFITIVLLSGFFFSWRLKRVVPAK